MPTAKPSRPKSVQTTAKPETAAIGAPKDTISTAEKPPVERWVSQPFRVPVILSPFQEFLVDTFADMLLRDAHHWDLENLVYGLCGHFHRRGYSYGSAEQQQKRVEDSASQDVSEWMKKIQAARPRQDQAAPGVPLTAPKAPESVAKRAGANLRNMLERELNHFLDTAAPQELWFLQEVMTTWDSTSCTIPAEMMEVSIATAFLVELKEAEDEYVHVPAEVKPLVMDYIALLTSRKAATA